MVNPVSPAAPAWTPERAAESLAAYYAAERLVWRKKNAAFRLKKGDERWVEELCNVGSRSEQSHVGSWAREVHRAYILAWWRRRKQPLRLVRGGGETTCPRSIRSPLRPGSGCSVTIPGFELRIERLSAPEAGARWRRIEGVPWPGRRNS